MLMVYNVRFIVLSGDAKDNKTQIDRHTLHEKMTRIQHFTPSRIFTYCYCYMERKLNQWRFQQYQPTNQPSITPIIVKLTRYSVINPDPGFRQAHISGWLNRLMEHKPYLS